MRTKPRFNKARKKAYKTLASHNISDFPIDLFEIMKSYKDLKVITYTQMAKKHNCTIKDIVEINSSEDGVIHYSGKRDKYIIIYNDTITPKERIYWTLAHELGHYLLGHHKESDRSSLNRNGITIGELDLFEVEANFFARHLLTPPPLIARGNINTFDKVMEVFGVSYTVASNTLKYMSDSYRMGYRFIFPPFIGSIFNAFIKKISYGKTCKSCNTFSYIKGAKYCLICGFDVFNIFKRGDDVDLIYPGYDLDNDMRVIRCPNCENEEVEGNYCKICATYLFNKCTGFDKNDDTDDYYRYGIRWGQYKDGCDLLLEGNARFCHECGSTSSFYVDGLLTDWDEEDDNEKELVTSGAPTDISDDLPF